MNIRQTLLVRKDLNMTPGLLAAQVAHISAQFMLNELKHGDVTKFSPVEKQWFSAPVLTVLSVENTEELEFFRNRCVEVDLNHNVWEDTIWSDNAKTFLKCVVGMSIGPHDDERIKQVTGGLKLY